MDEYDDVIPLKNKITLTIFKDLALLMRFNKVDPAE